MHNEYYSTKSTPKRNQITIPIQNMCKINRWSFYSSCVPGFLSKLHLKRPLSYNINVNCIPLSTTRYNLFWHTSINHKKFPEIKFDNLLSIRPIDGSFEIINISTMCVYIYIYIWPYFPLKWTVILNESRNTFWALFLCGLSISSLFRCNL